jgi:phage/plasmid-associated DNA primase
VLLETKIYRDEENRLGHFVAERCQIGPRETATAAALRSAYLSWCAANEEKPESRTAVANYLKATIGAMPGTDEHRTWRGIGLKPVQTDCLQGGAA